MTHAQVSALLEEKLARAKYNLAVSSLLAFEQGAAGCHSADVDRERERLSIAVISAAADLLD